MSDKPSLYVVEKKEVIILVVLFVLVTVLSFTLGVRYGESVGRKAAQEQEHAEEEHGEHGTVGGTLGSAGHGDEAAKPAEHGTESKNEHGAVEEKKAEHGATGDPGGEHGAPAASPSHDSHAPETAPKAAASSSPSHEAVDKNSDEYLLNALKEAGVEPPGGKAPKDAKLPEAVKAVKAPSSRALSGTYVIQVGSHPTRSEAESQVRQLKARKVQAEILPPFKDRQGEWHRVVVGSYRSKRDAEKEALSWKSKGAFVNFFIWRLP